MSNTMIWKLVALILMTVFVISFVTIAYMLVTAEPAASCWAHCLNAKVFARLLVLCAVCAGSMGIYSACVDRYRPWPK